MRRASALALVLWSATTVGSRAAQGLSVPGSASPVSSVNGQVGNVVVPTYTDSQAKAAAPVQSVNTNTGSVTIPAVQRQVSAALDISSGSVSWTFPAVFINSPTCWVSIASSSTTYVFDYPVTTALSKTAVTVTETAHPKALLAGVLFSSVNPPAGTTATLSCVGALP